MTLQAFLAIAPSVVAVVALVVAIRRPRVDQASDCVRSAADELTSSLQALRTVMYAAKMSPADPRAVRDATYDVDQRCRMYRSHLPVGLRHLRVGVRQAAANYFGGPAVYAIDPRAATLPLDPHEDHWWEIGVDYLEHAIDIIQRWRYGSARRGLKLCAFAQWRKDEDAAYYAARPPLSARTGTGATIV